MDLLLRRMESVEKMMLRTFVLLLEDYRGQLYEEYVQAVSEEEAEGMAKDIVADMNGGGVISVNEVDEFE